MLTLCHMTLCHENRRHAPLQVNPQTSSSSLKINFRLHHPFHIFKTGPVSYLPSPQPLFPTLSRLMPRIATFQLHSMHTYPTDLQSQLHADFNFHRQVLSLRECFWNVTQADVMRMLSGFGSRVVWAGWGVSWTGLDWRVGRCGGYFVSAYEHPV
jgi:hypothetical protein